MGTDSGADAPRAEESDSENAGRAQERRPASGRAPQLRRHTDRQWPQHQCGDGPRGRHKHISVGPSGRKSRPRFAIGTARPVVSPPPGLALRRLTVGHRPRAMVVSGETGRGFEPGTFRWLGARGVPGILLCGSGQSREVKEAQADRRAHRLAHHSDRWGAGKHEHHYQARYAS